MWAIESGNVSPEFRGIVTEFTFSWWFGFDPEVTRKMTNKKVEEYMAILEAKNKKEIIQDNQRSRRRW